MRLVRKTGVRAPWQSAPLPDVTVGRLAATMVVAAAVAIPGASVWMPRPLDGTPPPTRLSPPAVVVNQPPPPSFSTYTTYAPRLPNTDPLRPPLLVADPPDPTLQQPSAQLVGRLPRPEDPNWPARPAIAVGVPVPLPGAQAQLLAPPRPANADPLRPTAAIVGQQPTPAAPLWQPWPPRPANTDPLRPPLAQLGQQPTPAAPLWQPTPARLPNTDPLRPPIILAEAPDATLQQPATTWIGRLARDEDTGRPARPTVPILGPQPAPTSIALTSYAPRDQVPPPPDRLSVTAVLLGQQPSPLPSVWAPGAARLPNTDPLRPLSVQADPPDATLAQGAALPIGRLARPEDVNWPARPALVVGVPVPLPGAALWQPWPPRPANTDPLRPPQLQAEPPDATLQQPGQVWIGRLPRAEDTTRPARPAVALTGQQPTPSGLALATYALRDAVVVQPDRIAPAVVRVGQQPIPAAQALATIAPRPATTDPLRPTLAIIGAQPVPAGQVSWAGQPRSTPAERLALTCVTIGAQPQPGAQALPIGLPRDGDRLARTQVISGQQPAPASQAAFVGQPRDGDRLTRPIVAQGPQLLPQGLTLLGRPFGAEVVPPARLSIMLVPAAPTPAALRAAQARWSAMLGDDRAIGSPFPLHHRRPIGDLHGARDHDLTGARETDLTGDRDTSLSGRRSHRLTKRTR